MLLTKTLPPETKDDAGIGEKLISLLSDSKPGTSISFGKATEGTRLSKGAQEDDGDVDEVLRILEEPRR